MCSRFARYLTCALGAVLLTAASARHALAQSQAEYRAEVQRLVPIWRSVSAEYRHEDSLRVRALPQDTMHVGVLSVLVDSSLESLAHSAGTEASAALRRRFGVSADLIGTHLLTLTYPAKRQPDSATVVIGEIDSLGRAAGSTGIRGTTTLVSESMVSRGSQTLTDRLAPRFRRWLNGPLPVDTAMRDDWVGVRIDAVTSPYQASGACYSGSVVACERALGVVDEDHPVRSWFSPEERRDVVRHDGYALSRGQEDEYRACVTHDIAAACDTLADQIPIQGIQAPLGSAARQSLVRLAMDMGGPNAYARMASAPDTREAQLSAAAGVSIDSLVSVWRRHVIQTEAQQTTMTPGLALMSLVWVTTCGGLALGSSRWR